MRRKSYLFLIKLDYINREITEIKNKHTQIKPKPESKTEKALFRNV